jgi:hypothetical protein
MNPEIGRLCELFVSTWNDADPHRLVHGPEFTRAQQDHNDRELSAFVNVLQRESRFVRRTPTEDRRRERRVTAAFSRLASSAFGWESDQLEGPMAESFREALRAFPVEARRFDPAIPTTDIYQAARNALTLHCLQALLGAPLELTPAVLGYSLLYPYTDNLLDDPRATAATKLQFGKRLGERLRGMAVSPVGEREARIFALVGMIESQFERTSHPIVYESLVAIHDAQIRSLALLSAVRSGREHALAEIAVEKGGTSVLADGYLVSGKLTPRQAECVFGLGVYLQLRDDLEDVRDDAAAGVRTVFSARAGCLLDEPTTRALDVGAEVLARLDCFDAPQALPIRRIMVRSLPWMLSDAAASFPERYSPAYLAALERRSPFRFERLTAERRRLSRATGSLTGLLERWLTEETERRPQTSVCGATFSSAGSRPSPASHRLAETSI